MEQLNYQNTHSHTSDIIIAGDGPMLKGLVANINASMTTDEV